MSQFKQDNVDEIHDILDTLTTEDAARIFHKLTSADIIKLQRAIERAIKDATEKALEVGRMND
jgi:ribosomal protein S18